MLEQVFSKLLHMSFAAAWLVLAVLALRLLMRRAPRQVLVLLWALLAVRLLCPISIESRISLVPRPETVAQTVQPQPDSAIAEAESAQAPALHPGRVWLAGAAAMLLWALWGDVRLRRRVRVFLPLRRHVRVCEEIDTPFVLGVVHPKVYLPAGLNPADLEHVLKHEAAHIARRDHWWKPLGWLLLSVYWFHPLLWLSYVLFCRDLELACDERVAASLDREGLAAYSEALLRCSTRRGALASPVAFGETGVKTRVRAILRYRKPALRAVSAALLCVVIVGALFLTDRPAAALQLPETPAPEITPIREDDWTLPLSGRVESVSEQPAATPAPETAPAAALRTIDAAQTAPAQTPAVTAQDTHAEETAAAAETDSASPSRFRIASQTQTPMDPSAAEAPSASSAQENPGSSQPDPQGELARVGDVDVIRLFP